MPSETQADLMSLLRSRAERMERNARDVRRAASALVAAVLRHPTQLPAEIEAAKNELTRLAERAAKEEGMNDA